jgi:transposase InsO family protein
MGFLPTQQRRPTEKGLTAPSIRPALRAWDKISCDLITALPETASGYTAIYVVVDTLTKMVHFMPTTSDVNTEQSARLFVHGVWRLHGLPKEIISDRDPRFTGNFARAVCKIIGTKQSMSTAYHPESDGQTERVNGVLEDVLRHYVSPDQHNWDDYLPFAEFAINNAWHKSVRNTCSGRTVCLQSKTDRSVWSDDSYFPWIV